MILDAMNWTGLIKVYWYRSLDRDSLIKLFATTLKLANKTIIQYKATQMDGVVIRFAVI
jgi:hypothetical protein